MDSRCVIKKNTKYSLSTTELLKNLNENAIGLDIIGGITKNLEYTWLAQGSNFQVIATSTGVCVAACTFTGNLRDGQAKITCVTEMSCKNSKAPLFVIGCECDFFRGMLCIFDIVGSRVLRTIYFDDKISSVNVVNGSDIAWLPGPFSFMSGVVAAGTVGGHVLLVDLCRDHWHDDQPLCRLSVHTFAEQPDLEAIKNELPSDTHLAVLINGNSLSEPCFTMYTPQGERAFRVELRMNVKISALLYVPQLMSLFVGYNFGAFQIYNLLSMDLEYTSPVYEEFVPVSYFTFQEPSDDPRAFCYIWTVYSDTDATNEPTVPLSAMYSLAYKSKESVQNYGILYQKFMSCSLRFQMDLMPLNDGEAYKGICIALETYANPTGSQTKDHSVDQSMSLCMVAWRSWSKDKEEPDLILCLFDLNQWYKEQMPDGTRQEDNRGYIAKHVISNAIPDCADSLLTVKICPESLSLFSTVQCLEEHYFPSALTFELISVLPAGIINALCFGEQRAVLQTISSGGAEVLLAAPDILADACVAAGLQPLGCDMPVEPRFLLLSVALEHTLLSVLTSAATQWAAGAHASEGCSLGFFVKWASMRSEQLQQKANEICVPLFDYSDITLDANTRRLLDQCILQLHHLTTIFNIIQKKCARYLNNEAAKEIQDQLRALQMMSTYLDILQWLLNVGLLPEANPDSYESELDSSGHLRAPYPVDSFAQFYEERRKLLRPNNPKHKPCNVLFIDTLIERECGGKKLRKQWALAVNGETAKKSLGLYPPRSLQALLRTYLLDGIPLHYKHMVLVYVFLDLAVSLDQTRFPSIITHLIKFPAVFKLSPSLIKTTQAFWQLDHGDFNTAMEQLLDPFVVGNHGNICPWQHRIVLRALLIQDHYKHALHYLQIRQPPMMETRDICIAISLLLANNLLQAAFHFQRQHRTKDNMKRILDHFFRECFAYNLIPSVMRLFLLPEEEEALTSQIQIWQKHQKEEKHLKILYYLQRNRGLEVKGSEDQKFINNLDLIFTKQGLDGQQKADVEELLLDAYVGTVPNVKKVLFDADKLYSKTIIQELPKPVPMSIKINSVYQSKQKPAEIMKNLMSIRQNQKPTNLNNSLFSQTPDKKVTITRKCDTSITVPNISYHYVDETNARSFLDKSSSSPMEIDEERWEESTAKRRKMTDGTAVFVKDTAPDRLLHTPVVRRKRPVPSTVSVENTPQSILKVRQTPLKQLLEEDIDEEERSCNVESDEENNLAEEIVKKDVTTTTNETSIPSCFLKVTPRKSLHSVHFIEEPKLISESENKTNIEENTKQLDESETSLTKPLPEETSCEVEKNETDVVDLETTENQKSSQESLDSSDYSPKQILDPDSSVETSNPYKHIKKRKSLYQAVLDNVKMSNPSTPDISLPNITSTPIRNEYRKSDFNKSMESTFTETPIKRRILLSNDSNINVEFVEQYFNIKMRSSDASVKNIEESKLVIATGEDKKLEVIEKEEKEVHEVTSEPINTTEISEISERSHYLKPDSDVDSSFYEKHIPSSQNEVTKSDNIVFEDATRNEEKPPAICVENDPLSMENEQILSVENKTAISEPVITVVEEQNWESEYEKQLEMHHSDPVLNECNLNNSSDEEEEDKELCELKVNELQPVPVEEFENIQVQEDNYLELDSDIEENKQDFVKDIDKEHILESEDEKSSSDDEEIEKDISENEVIEIDSDDDDVQVTENRRKTEDEESGDDESYISDEESDVYEDENEKRQEEIVEAKSIEELESGSSVGSYENVLVGKGSDEEIEDEENVEEEEIEEEENVVEEEIEEEENVVEEEIEEEENVVEEEIEEEENVGEEDEDVEVREKDTEEDSEEVEENIEDEKDNVVEIKETDTEDLEREENLEEAEIFIDAEKNENVINGKEKENGLELSGKMEVADEENSDCETVKLELEEDEEIDVENIDNQETENSDNGEPVLVIDEGENSENQEESEELRMEETEDDNLNKNMISEKIEKEDIEMNKDIDNVKVTEVQQNITYPHDSLITDDESDMSFQKSIVMEVKKDIVEFTCDANIESDPLTTQNVGESLQKSSEQENTQDTVSRITTRSRSNSLTSQEKIELPVVRTRNRASSVSSHTSENITKVRSTSQDKVESSVTLSGKDESSNISVVKTRSRAGSVSSQTSEDVTKVRSTSSTSQDKVESSATLSGKDESSNIPVVKTRSRAGSVSSQTSEDVIKAKSTSLTSQENVSLDTLSGKDVSSNIPGVKTRSRAGSVSSQTSEDVTKIKSTSLASQDKIESSMALSRKDVSHNIPVVKTRSRAGSVSSQTSEDVTKVRSTSLTSQDKVESSAILSGKDVSQNIPVVKTRSKAGSVSSQTSEDVTKVRSTSLTSQDKVESSAILSSKDVSSNIPVVKTRSRAGSVSSQTSEDVIKVKSTSLTSQEKVESSATLSVKDVSPNVPVLKTHSRASSVSSHTSEDVTKVDEIKPKRRSTRKSSSVIDESISKPLPRTTRSRSVTISPVKLDESITSKSRKGRKSLVVLEENVTKLSTDIEENKDNVKPRKNRKASSVSEISDIKPARRTRSTSISEDVKASDVSLLDVSRTEQNVSLNESKDGSDLIEMYSSTRRLTRRQKNLMIQSLPQVKEEDRLFSDIKNEGEKEDLSSDSKRVQGYEQSSPTSSIKSTSSVRSRVKKQLLPKDSLSQSPAQNTRSHDTATSSPAISNDPVFTKTKGRRSLSNETVPVPSPTRRSLRLSHTSDHSDSGSSVVSSVTSSQPAEKMRRSRRTKSHSQSPPETESKIPKFEILSPKPKSKINRKSLRPKKNLTAITEEDSLNQEEIEAATTTETRQLRSVSEEPVEKLSRGRSLVFLSPVKEEEIEKTRQSLLAFESNKRKSTTLTTQRRKVFRLSRASSTS